MFLAFINRFFPYKSVVTCANCITGSKQRYHLLPRIERELVKLHKFYFTVQNGAVWFEILHYLSFHICVYIRLIKFCLVYKFLFAKTFWFLAYLYLILNCASLAFIIKIIIFIRACHLCMHYTVISLSKQKNKFVLSFFYYMNFNICAYNFYLSFLN